VAGAPGGTPGPAATALSPGDAQTIIAQRLGVESDDLDGWTVATNLSRSGFALPTPELREYARTLAAHAVLRRAAQLVGPYRRPSHPVRETMGEPFRGELEIDETLESMAGKSSPDPDDWIVERREEREQQVVLMMDASLSMAGENLAMAAVATAALALKMRTEDLALVVFESKARVLSSLEERDDPERLVTAMLSEPARGYTNIEDALKVGARELRRGRNPRKAGLLITDGVFTAGGDPTELAADFPRLFVLLTEDYKMNPELCATLAARGRGEVFRVRHLRQLPARVVEIADRVLR
jgi:Ca-activated chloride channel homolog